MHSTTGQLQTIPSCASTQITQGAYSMVAARP
ncbi:Uncharacterised protein [Bordetella pertussis]|nr:Uncharacterised protein [Bordetella pertussis]CPM27714.1 Uncharacterised protein [Bordetella pertussis]CPO18402.1 Uncharacterised protein [Bordetella pertussis]